MEEMRLEHRGEEVVRGPDCVDVSREMEVDLLHRDDLRAAAARSATLDPEHRSE
jgi:hypothetical protein